MDLRARAEVDGGSYSNTSSRRGDARLTSPCALLSPCVAAVSVLWITMDPKLMYAFRGWIGFVAFMDLGTAVRCFIEKRAFFGQYANANAVANQHTEEGKFGRNGR